MVKNLIGIIDYGMGNLRSVSKAFEALGGSVYVGSNPEKLSRSNKLVLPGVGAFGDAMSELKKRKLILTIRNFINDGKPFFGICLGLQLLFEGSDENKGIPGLGIFKGTVKRFPKDQTNELKIPHMGWNQVNIKMKSPILKKILKNSHFYFVHSYYGKPKRTEIIAGETDYGITFPAILSQANIFAAQFHPEKSQKMGLQILKNFIEI
ncbi:MAG: imidazole glycerol phosphate synthase, glutamine amidotransferase subunit [Omnitrophica bacterium RIFCSPLOWO2_12_FULL_44_17]|uniref:Imidazole glycerol phosphate synthase subunit HisH n=1 Tax=Candidatus Danuiimicrobium aquiferis TaxID=1801832 RepID=A0A1G1KYJ1_9BACT|nr:MAG: imidazole glycerol phosphate synthase, glutamine amidotransferase subunit [Omnitrophica bacterium RIFCSPHIGHO2_02_FULL_45_28]OGW90227.1 MAG: imidazole glycerol phosphate synthase, glutamine amidotransferase subunit [Omnitrophica bacterium RIFCSPHIGHO2_12_FULL_44_12]OGW97986.1 MAG: imidazole glycerol phosphate synthase, glutamine amidotransferase subunit [Omnitrophica bacterium RIFCSPLOWO2_12_FULL_44_17]OGX03570.1 MAG: imidazole glycerol phosphate synthase, glutamine amidotransferase subu